MCRKKEELARLFKICKKYGVYIISDEIHQDLIFDGSRHIPSLSVEGYQDHMIMLAAPSKTFNLAAGQNSLVIIPDEKLRNLWDQYTTANRVISGNAFGYIAAQAAYEGGETWLEDVLEKNMG